MRKFIDYKPKTDDKQTEVLAMCCPRGMAWDGKGSQDSTLYKLLKSIATELNAVEEKIYEMVVQWNINFTTDLISEWEFAVGIPDECRAAAEDIATRRSDVITKLKKVPVIDVADYEALAESITGVVGWNIRPGMNDFPSNPLYKFVLLVTAPVNSFGGFSYPFGSGITSISNLVHNGSDTATATVADTSTMEDGSIATISGADQSDYNGDFVITVTGGTTFTYPVPGTPVTPATGTFTVNFGIDQTQVDALEANTQFVSPTGVALPGYPFSGQFRISVLRCVFRKVSPATIDIVYD